jgi:hypothetical protein
MCKTLTNSYIDFTKIIDSNVINYLIPLQE